MLPKERDFYYESRTVNLEDLEYTNFFNDPDRKQYQGIFTQANKNSSVPIILDYGSYATKVGWGNQDIPSLIFRTVVSKNKDVKNSDGVVYVGNKLREFDYTKNNYKTPFERNVIQHFGLLENINDYIFSELMINDSRINHPIVATECLANPEYCRSRFLEQMFECYQVPSVLLGVDSLFSYSMNTTNTQDDCLIISFGHTTTHIIPIINGKMQMKDIKRINVGGYNSFDLTYRHLNLKYPIYKAKLGQNYVQGIFENLCFVANDYSQQLKYFNEGKSSFVNNCYKNQIQFENDKIGKDSLIKQMQEPVVLEFPVQQEQVISENREYDNIYKYAIKFSVSPLIEQFKAKNSPFSQTTFQQQSTEDKQKKLALRQEQAKRLRDTMARRKKEKEEQHRNELKELEQAQSEIEKEESKTDSILKHYEFESKDEMENKIQKLKIKLGLMKKEEVPIEDRFHLINIPDEQLSAEDQRKKRYQIMQKQAAITRKLKKEMESKKRDEKQKLKEEKPEEYLADLYEKRKKIINEIEEMNKLKNVHTGQRSSRSSKRIQLSMAQLADTSKDKKGVDTFGKDDKDWDIYKNMDEDNEKMYQERLKEIEKELRDLDPCFEDMINNTDQEILELFPTGFNSIELGVDLIRGPEVLFQPSLCGSDQMGLIDTIELMLRNSKYTDEVKQNLLGNIFLTGGVAFTKKLKARLEKELESISSQGTKINITMAKDPIFDAWRGMYQFSKKKENLTNFSITREEYEEYGQNYFKSNPFSNIYDL